MQLTTFTFVLVSGFGNRERSTQRAFGSSVSERFEMGFFLLVFLLDSADSTTSVFDVVHRKIEI